MVESTLGTFQRHSKQRRVGLYQDPLLLYRQEKMSGEGVFSIFQ